jgi:hypothetical protein
MADGRGASWRKVGNMNLVLLLAWAVSIGISIWLTVLFVLLCIRVKAIKAILITAYDLEEFKGQHGFAYRKRRRPLDDETKSQI